MDNHEKLNNCFPNLVLMKLSAWHKSQGDTVEWHDPLFGGHYDKVYMSKVFSFTPDYEWCIDADEIVRGGTGYCISLVDGKEAFDKSKDIELPYEIEHIMPDYSLYGITDTAYGFMSRGCPRGCDFCHVKDKEGLCSVKVADLSEFWKGQKYIQLFDPNTLACKDWKDILQQLVDSNSWVDFNQGVDIRCMTEEKAEMIKRCKVKNIHFAWDRYEDKKNVVPRFELFKKITGFDYRKMSVYMLTNFDTTFEQDLERVNILKEMGYNPYVMVYEKYKTKPTDKVRKLQRYVNNRIIFRSCSTFEDYLKGGG